MAGLYRPRLSLLWAGPHTGIPTADHSWSAARTSWSWLWLVLSRGCRLGRRWKALGLRDFPREEHVANFIGCKWSAQTMAASCGYAVQKTAFSTDSISPFRSLEVVCTSGQSRASAGLRRHSVVNESVNWDCWWGWGQVSARRCADVAKRCLPDPAAPARKPRSEGPSAAMRATTAPP